MDTTRTTAAAALLATLTGIAPAQDDLRTLLDKAHAAVKQKQYTKAIELLRNADRSGEDKRVEQVLTYAYHNRAMEHFRGDKKHLAYQDFQAANRLTPNHEKILQSLGVVTFALGRKREAEEYMRRVLRINPKNPEALRVLGEQASSRGDSAAASEFFKGAAEGSPERKDYRHLADKYGREAEIEGSFVTSDQGNFRVEFEKGQTAGVEQAIKSVHSYLEQGYRELQTALGGQPADKVTVVVYNPTQYRKVSGARHWARAYFDGKIRVAVKEWPQGRSDLRKDLRHELTHAFLHHLAPKAPAWLHEGLAQQIEGASPGLAKSLLKRTKTLPLKLFLAEFASAGNPAVIRVGYAQSLVLVDHLAKIGNRGKLIELLKEFRGSDDSQRLVRTIYGKGIEELLEDAMR